jgi:hypothetical protein
MRQSDSCPHCGRPEDSAHVWQCKSPTIIPVWENSLNNLRQSLRKLDTDPDISTAIIKYLQAWRSDHSLQSLTTETLYHILELQEDIGARQFFEGWIHAEWEHKQKAYYTSINSRHSSKRWTIALITKLWEIAWDLWEFWNTVYHQQQNISLQEDTVRLDVQVRELVHNIEMIGLLPKDSHLSDIPITRVTEFPRHTKTEWIRQVALALEQAKKRHFLSRQSRNEQHRRHQIMIQSMQLFMRNWIHRLDDF